MLYAKHYLNLITMSLILSVTHAYAENYEQYAIQQAKNEQIVIAPYEKEAQTLTASLQQRQASGDIQQFALWLQTQTAKQAPNASQKRYSPILIFISFSMPKDSLKQYLAQASQVNGSLVIRGLINNSFKDTAAILTPLLKEQPGGLLLDPTLFKRYNIQKVPAVVVHNNSTCPSNESCIDTYALVYGNTTLHYALNKIASSKTPVAEVAAQAVNKLEEIHHAN